MAFYIRKHLESGPLRFAVGERTIDGHDEDQRFSTGARGEYRPIRRTSLYFGEQRHGEGARLTNVAQFPELEDEPVLSPQMWSSVGIGVIFLLLGVGVLAIKKDMIGILEVIIGVLLIVTPFARTWQKRRELRLKREKILAERAAEEARLQALIGTFAENIRQLRTKRDPELLREISRERASIDVPYEAILATARPVLLAIGFELIAKYPERSLREIAAELQAVSQAVALQMEDETKIFAEIVRRVTWHLLADDRMSDSRRKLVEELATELRVPSELLEAERAATDEFIRLRGVGLQSLTPRRADLPLAFNEVCLMQTVGGKAARRKKAEGTVYITSKRIAIVNGKQDDTAIGSIFDVELDSDEKTLHVTMSNRKKNFALTVERPIETAAIVDILATHTRGTAMML